MEALLKTLEEHWLGVLMLILILFALIFSVGRVLHMIKRNSRWSAPNRQDLGFAFQAWMTQLISDFRHLLALLIVAIFAVVLIYAMSAAGCDVKQMAEALQAVMATLGGLVGSIIGFYFGSEKKGTGEAKDPTNTKPPATPVATPGNGPNADVPAPAPPSMEEIKPAGN